VKQLTEHKQAAINRAYEGGRLFICHHWNAFMKDAQPIELTSEIFGKGIQWNRNPIAI
jgi:hypothetical protein